MNIVKRKYRKRSDCVDITGRRFGMLTAVEEAGRTPSLAPVWWCICDCGTRKQIIKTSLVGGKATSCGCEFKKRMSVRVTTHGLSRSKTYKLWQSMVDRCKNPLNKAYKNYGGRGIRVCDRWLKFEGFYSDMGDRPDGLTLERVDNDGDYCLENCRWASYKEQLRNTRRNRFIEYSGESRCIAEWAEILGVNQSLLRRKIEKLPLDIAMDPSKW